MKKISVVEVIYSLLKGGLEIFYFADKEGVWETFLLESTEVNSAGFYIICKNVSTSCQRGKEYQDDYSRFEKFVFDKKEYKFFKTKEEATLERAKIIAKAMEGEVEWY